MEEIIYYKNHIMVPVDANVYLLELWEIILIIISHVWNGSCVRNVYNNTNRVLDKKTN